MGRRGSDGYVVNICVQLVPRLRLGGPCTSVAITLPPHGRRKTLVRNKGEEAKKKAYVPFSRTNKQANSVLISVLTAVKTIKRMF